MHFPLTAGQILWALTFAAQLTLLVVLLGRDRIKRFPWFTASIVLFALRLLVEVLLSGRMAQLPLRATFIMLADMMAITGLLVVVELARRAFAGAQRKTVVIWTVVLLAIGAAVLKFWGPWPSLKGMAFDSPLALFGLMQLFAQKADMLMDVLTILLALLVFAFGRRFKAGWQSHTQQIIIGLSAVAISWLAVQGIWQIIAASVHPTSQEDYERIIGLGGKLVNANKTVYLAALVWWIFCLWRNDPSVPAAVPVPAEPPVESTEPQPAAAEPAPSEPAE